jgi:type II restriction/modification system DNA methylase subunit YeeA
MWIIDFGVGMLEPEAALYQAPFEYARKAVKPKREVSKSTRPEWWLHERPRPEMRNALSGLVRYLATPTVAKHRAFVWMSAEVLPDHQLIVFARDDYFLLGVLHSRYHEAWALRKGTSLEDRPRYTPTSTFETFPFPVASLEQRAAIAAAASEVDLHRTAWLKPEGASAAELGRRTLTNLYNERPTWLMNDHATLDAAVSAAYGWPTEISEDDALARLLALNLERDPA